MRSEKGEKRNFFINIYEVEENPARESTIVAAAEITQKTKENGANPKSSS